MTRILVAEDDPDISALVQRYLEKAGFSVEVAASGRATMNAIATRAPDLLVLDVMLPHMDGLEVCRAVRGNVQTAGIPIIMLTARGEESDRIRGLETGADDYVTKPFSPRELVARVGAVLRRVRPALAAEQLGYDDVEMDVAAHRVRRAGKPISLGPTEFRLLRHFLENPGRVFSRERLLDSVWSHDPDIDLRTVDVHVRRLRKALNDGGRRDIIRTVRSAGYSLDADA